MDMASRTRKATKFVQPIGVATNALDEDAYTKVRTVKQCPE